MQINHVAFYNCTRCFPNVKGIPASFSKQHVSSKRQRERRVQIDQIHISDFLRCVIKLLNKEWPCEPTQKTLLNQEDRRMLGDDSFRTKERIDEKDIFCKSCKIAVWKKDTGIKSEVKGCARMLTRKTKKRWHFLQHKGKRRHRGKKWFELGGQGRWSMNISE